MSVSARESGITLKGFNKAQQDVAMGNKADMQIRQLGEPEQEDSGTDSMSISENSTTSQSEASGKDKEKRRFGSARLLRWRGGSKKESLKGELKIVILVCIQCFVDSQLCD